MQPKIGQETGSTQIKYSKGLRRKARKRVNKKKSKEQIDIKQQLQQIANELPVLPMPVPTDNFIEMEGKDFKQVINEDMEQMPDENIVPIPEFEVQYVTSETHYFDLKAIWDSTVEKGEKEAVKAIKDHVKYVHSRDKECQKNYPHLYETKKTTGEAIAYENINS